MLNILKNIKGLLRNENKLINSQLGALFHTSNVLDRKIDDRKKMQKWPRWNREIYEPQTPDEEPRPAVSYNSLRKALITTSLLVCLSSKGKHQIQS